MGQSSIVGRTGFFPRTFSYSAAVVFMDRLFRFKSPGELNLRTQTWLSLRPQKHSQSSSSIRYKCVGGNSIFSASLESQRHNRDRALWLRRDQSSLQKAWPRSFVSLALSHPLAQMEISQWTQFWERTKKLGFVMRVECKVTSLQYHENTCYSVGLEERTRTSHTWVDL